MSFNYYDNFDGSGVDLGSQGGVYDLGIYPEEKDKAGLNILFSHLYFIYYF